MMDKTITVRLPINNYNKLMKVCEDLNTSASEFIREKLMMKIDTEYIDEQIRYHEYRLSLLKKPDTISNNKQNNIIVCKQKKDPEDNKIVMEIKNNIWRKIMEKCPDLLNKEFEEKDIINVLNKELITVDNDIIGDVFYEIYWSLHKFVFQYNQEEFNVFITKINNKQCKTEYVLQRITNNVIHCNT